MPPEQHPRINVECILRAQQGDLDAFSAIIDRYHDAVYHFVSRQIGNEADAADVVQESFIKLYFALDQFDPGKKFSTWLFAIVKNTINDWLRKKYSQTKAATAADIVEREAVSAQLRDHSIENQLDIRTALSRISPRYQRILRLYYWRGCTYAEMAEILSLPLNTVKTLMRRARQALAFEIKREG